MGKGKDLLIKKVFVILIIMVLFSALLQPVFASQENIDFSDKNIQNIENYITKQIKKAKIPGMGVVIVKNNEIAYMNGFGYADLKSKTPVTPDTLFETASCSKNYTAVAVFKLVEEGKIKLDDSVSKFFPGFYMLYKDKKYDLTIAQLLHHSSGIPDTTIVKIPPSDSTDALEQVVNNLVGTKLRYLPGERFSYATINYDVLGAIVQKVSGIVFEDYMSDNVFKPLHLNNTTLYNQDTNPKMASGYKMRFFKAVRYFPPIYRGNRPAGYVITNLNDTARWLMLQLGTENSNLYPVIQETHVPDRTVEPSQFDYGTYASGWAAYQYGSGEIAKSGMNPTFSAYMAFRPEDKIGVAVFSNLGTEYTFVTGHGILNMLQGKAPKSYYRPEDGLAAWDNPSFIITLFCSMLILLLLAYIGIAIYELIKRKRGFKGFKLKYIGILFFTIPFAVGLYIFPGSLGYSWETATVWLPHSFLIAVVSIISAAILAYLCYLVLVIFQPKDKSVNLIPGLIVLSLLSGIGNYNVIAIINNYIYDNNFLAYKIYYFVLAMVIYIFGRKIIETKLIQITNKIIYEKRMDLMRQIFATPYNEYEKIDNGRIMATLNNDTETVSNSANIIVAFITSAITIICCFIYLGNISFLGMVISFIVVIFISTVYGITTKRVQVYLEQARDTQNIFMGYIDSMIKGFKELSLHLGKKKEFKDDVGKCCEEYRDKRNISRIKFLNVFLVGESLLIIVLGIIVFSFPNIFENIQDYTLAKFTIIFLYLIGPINGLLNAVPQIAQMMVSWNRIKDFSSEIPERTLSIRPEAMEEAAAGLNVTADLSIESVSLNDVYYKYNNVKENSDKDFSIGPINLEIAKGEILFITGGNGSGKSTLAKVITGLYPADGGNILVNNKQADIERLGEMFSAIFGDFYLFDRLYEIDFEAKKNEIEKYLKMLNLDQKVEIKDGRFSTTKLSAGQRKRLALLISLLEDRPIYLFDEWAADQDPQFRKYFYRNILVEMKLKGKIIIAITHDDHYFDIADRIIKMEEGKIERMYSEKKFA